MKKTQTGEMHELFYP